MMKYLILLFICLYFLNACTKKVPILEPAKMETVLWDIIQLEAYAQLIVPPDSQKMSAKKNALLQQKIFSLHGVNREQYYKSYEFYNERPDMMRIILDSVINKADRNRDKIMQRRYGKTGIIK